VSMITVQQSAAYIEQVVTIERDVTCLEGDARILGWPQDVCDGTHTEALLNYSTKVADMVEQLPLAAREGLVSPLFESCLASSATFCAQATQSFEPWGNGVCANQFTIRALAGNASDSDDDTNQPVRSLPQGCSKSCECCGAKCNQVHLTVPANPRSQPMALILFLHDYARDDHQAWEQYHLQTLVDFHNVMIVAPNGRQDDVGFAYWLAGDTFTGNFMAAMDIDTGKMTSPDDVDAHTSVSYEEQYDIVAYQNPDMEHIRNVVEYVMSNYDINTDLTFALGVGNGADMALQVACNMSETFAAVVAHDGAGYTLNGTRATYCKPVYPIHVLSVLNKEDPYDASAEELAHFWAVHNRCDGANLTQSGQKHLLYNDTYDDVTSFDTVSFNTNAEPCAAGGSFSLWKVNGGNRASALDPYTFPGALWVYLAMHTPQASLYQSPNNSANTHLAFGWVWIPPVPILMICACVVFRWYEMLPMFKKKRNNVLMDRRQNGYRDGIQDYGSIPNNEEQYDNEDDEFI